MHTITPTQLADLIEQGSKLPGVQQRREENAVHFIERRGNTIYACAMGAGMLAAHPELLRDRDKVTGDDDDLGLLLPHVNVRPTHPVTGQPPGWISVNSLVVELNDTYKWTLKRIVKWLRTLE